jgi:hypothetical protein
MDPVSEIIAKYPDEWKAYQDGLDITFGNSPFMTELYDHFVGTGEMPYGIAKARDGDPDVWITNKLEQYLDD